MLGLNYRYWQLRFQQGREDTDLIGRQGLAEFKVHPCREIVHSSGPARKVTPSSSPTHSHSTKSALESHNLLPHACTLHIADTCTHT